MSDMFAVAEFGSTCRSETDANSDRDLLVVCAPAEKHPMLETYRTSGYSLSFHTERQLEGMRTFGSLFLQHLRYESRILIDSGGHFARFLDTCEFKHPTAVEISRCEDSIEFALRFELDPATEAWKADYLFCLARDYLIKQLASEGEIAFGIPDIYAAARRYWGFNQQDKDTLVRLRELKARYRSGDTSFRDGEGLFRSTLSMLRKVSPGLLRIDQSEKLGIAAVENRQYRSPYERLRVFEALYGAYRRCNYVHPEHFRILSLIQRPNMYGGASKRGENAVEKYLHQIVCALTANKSLQRTFDPQPILLPQNGPRLKRR